MVLACCRVTTVEADTGVCADRRVFVEGRKGAEGGEGRRRPTLVVHLHLDFSDVLKAR